MTRNIITTCLLHFFLLSGTHQAQAIEYKYPSNSKVLFYAPGYSTPGDEQDAITKNGLILFGKAVNFNADVTPLPDHEASVEAVKTFGDYGAIFIHTHGWYWTYPWEFYQKKSNLEFSCFRTGTFVQFPLAPNSPYADELANHRLVVSKNPNTQGVYHYVVTPEYIEKHLAPNALDGAFFFLGVCASFKDNQFLHSGMWDALVSKGAKVGFGYSDYVSRSHNVDMFNQLMNADGMLPADSNISPKTAGEAYTNISDTMDDYHVMAEFEKETASPEWDNFVFDEPDSEILRIRLTYSGPDFYSCYWNMNTDSEFEVRDTQTGDVLPQPIHESLIASTNVAEMTWDNDSYYVQAYPQVVPDLMDISWVDETQKLYPSFLATSPYWPGEISQTTTEEVLPPNHCSDASGTPSVAIRSTLSNFPISSSVLTGPLTTGITRGLLPKQLQFKNSPTIGMATKIKGTFIQRFFCSNYCGSEKTDKIEGETHIFNEVFTYYSYRDAYVVSGNSFYMQMKMLGNGNRHGFVNTDTVKADIIYIPYYNYDSGRRTEEEACELLDTNTTGEDLTPKDTDFSHFQIIGGFSSKRDVLTREANATEDTWDDYQYATDNGNLNTWLHDRISSLSSNPVSMSDVPWQINCATNIK